MTVEDETPTTPWWYHVALGVLIGAGVVAIYSSSGIWPSIITLAVILLISILDRSTRWLRPRARLGKVRPAYIVFGVVGFVLLSGILAGTWYLVRVLGLGWAAWVAGVIVLGLAIVGSRLQDRLQ